MGKPRKFMLTVTCEQMLDTEQIWPDGDAPANPTAADVAKVIEKCGGAVRVIRDWDLDNDLYLEVGDEDGGHEVVT